MNFLQILSENCSLVIYILLSVFLRNATLYMQFKRGHCLAAGTGRTLNRHRLL